MTAQCTVAPACTAPAGFTMVTDVDEFTAEMMKVPLLPAAVAFETTICAPTYDDSMPLSPLSTECELSAPAAVDAVSPPASVTGLDVHSCKLPDRSCALPPLAAPKST